MTHNNKYSIILKIIIVEFDKSEGLSRIKVILQSE